MEKTLLPSTGIHSILSPDQSSAYINWKDDESVITAISLPDASNIIISNNNNDKFPKSSVI